MAEIIFIFDIGKACTRMVPVTLIVINFYLMSVDLTASIDRMISGR
jgi:hypothetical protein